MSAISFKNINKTFHFHKPKVGPWWKFAREKASVEAVRNLSFTITPGERVAFIGPNGAGKSTTIKMLTGILTPTSGEILLNGRSPHNNRMALCRELGIVFGNRSQLWKKLPVKDSFELLRAVYGVERATHERRLHEILPLLDVERLLNQRAESLSLGERMRCELVASLLHGPKFLILDEPTIGLDVDGRAVLRSYIKRCSKLDGITVLLTSHDTADIAEVCDRVLVINHGSLILDESVDTLRRGFISKKIVKIVTTEAAAAISLAGVVESSRSATTVAYEVDTKICSVDKLIRAICEAGPIVDMTIEDPPLEETISLIYSGNAGSPDRTCSGSAL